MDRIVKDSSIWRNASATSLLYEKDTAIRVGTVKEIKEIGKNKERKYVVEVFDKTNFIPVMCVQMVRFGGIYNYEEYSIRGYEIDKNDTARGEYAVIPGDTVVIAYINGDSREGIILGSIKHDGRNNLVNKADDIAYISEFNGVEKKINKDGELTLTFKGQPKNYAKLKNSPTGKPLEKADYDKEIGSTFYKFDKTGGWMLSDNATKDAQSLYVDKKAGKIIVTSGKIVLTMEKASETTSLKTKILNIDSTDKINEKTKDWVMDASATTKIRSPKIAIGSGGVELLDKLVKLIENLGKITAISPVGPCATLMASPQWGQVEQVKAAINSIKGTL